MHRYNLRPVGTRSWLLYYNCTVVTTVLWKSASKQASTWWPLLYYRTVDCSVGQHWYASSRIVYIHCSVGVLLATRHCVIGRKYRVMDHCGPAVNQHVVLHCAACLAAVLRCGHPSALCNYIQYSVYNSSVTFIIFHILQLNVLKSCNPE